MVSQGTLCKAFTYIRKNVAKKSLYWLQKQNATTNGNVVWKKTNWELWNFNYTKFIRVLGNTMKLTSLIYIYMYYNYSKFIIAIRLININN